MAGFNTEEDEEKGFFGAVADVATSPLKAFQGRDTAVMEERAANTTPSQAIPQNAFAQEEFVPDAQEEAEIQVLRDSQRLKRQAAKAEAGAIDAGAQAAEEQKANLSSTLEQEKLARDEAEAKNREAAELRKQRQDALSLAEADINNKVAEQQAEIDAIEPKNFWQKADTGDKIGMALAIALGAIGQGMSGAKTNLALEAMNKVIADDLNLQKDTMQRKVDAMGRTKAGLKDIQAAKDQMNVEFKLRKARALEELESKLAQFKSQTTNINTLGAIDQQIAKLGIAKAGIKESLAKDTKTSAAKTIARNEGLAKIDPEALKNMSAKEQAQAAQALEKFDMKRPFGQGMDLKGDQAKSAAFLTKNDKNIQEIEGLESEFTPAEFAALKDAMQSTVNRAQRTSAPLVGGLFAAIETGVRGSPAEVMEAAVPGKGGKYYNAMFNFVNDQTRVESGAAISEGEFVATMQKYFPTATTNSNEMGRLVNARRDILKSHKTLSGAKRPLFFEVGVK